MVSGKFTDAVNAYVDARGRYNSAVNRLNGARVKLKNVQEQVATCQAQADKACLDMDRTLVALQDAFADEPCQTNARTEGASTPTWLDELLTDLRAISSDVRKMI